MKESATNEKYVILFTDIFNLRSNDDEKIEESFRKLKGDKSIVFLLVGKNKNLHSPHEIDKTFEKLILNKFGEKSEIINFENMKKIKTILSNNSVIKDEIVYPNEIYK